MVSRSADRSSSMKSWSLAIESPRIAWKKARPRRHLALEVAGQESELVLARRVLRPQQKHAVVVAVLRRERVGLAARPARSWAARPACRGRSPPSAWSCRSRPGRRARPAARPGRAGTPSEVWAGSRGVKPSTGRGRYWLRLRSQNWEKRRSSIRFRSGLARVTSVVSPQRTTTPSSTPSRLARGSAPLEGQPALPRRAAVVEALEVLLVELAVDDAAEDLVDAVERDLAVAQVLAAMPIESHLSRRLESSEITITS